MINNPAIFLTHIRPAFRPAFSRRPPTASENIPGRLNSKWIPWGALQLAGEKRGGWAVELRIAIRFSGGGAAGFRVAGRFGLHPRAIMTAIAVLTMK